MMPYPVMSNSFNDPPYRSTDRTSPEPPSRPCNTINGVLIDRHLVHNYTAVMELDANLNRRMIPF